MVTANGPLMSRTAALRPAGNHAHGLKAVLGALLLILAVGALTAVVITALAGQSTVALVIAILTGAVFAALIV